MQHHFLDDPRVLSVHLACALGINEALIISQLHYWLKHARRKHQGKMWVYNTLDQWHSLLPFLSKMTIRRAIGRLEEAGIILSKELGKKRDRTKYYTLDYDKLDAIWSKCTDEPVQNEQLQVFKMNSSLHNNTHENTAEDTDAKSEGVESMKNELKEVALKGDSKALLEKIQDMKALEPKPPVKMSHDAFFKWWCKLCKFHSDDSQFKVESTTKKVLGQVKLFREKCDGKDVDVAKAVVRDWGTFRMRVQAMKGGEVPTEPTIDHMLKHVDLAVEFSNEKVEVKPKVQLSALKEKKASAGLGSGKKGWD